MSDPGPQFIRLCSVEDVPEPSLKRFIIEGDEILLARFRGQYYALDERCTHRGGPLSEGTIEDGAVTCPWHFGHFSLITGQPVSPPPMVPLRRHVVRVENGSVFLSKRS
jgi:nitrite reductase/ring-hydroxylating ferredoxin subunit